MSQAVRAVVVRWRGGDEVRRCLDSLRRHGGAHIEATVLVDSGSGDGEAERLAEHYPDIRVLPLDTNRGFAYAVDRGFGDGHEPYLLLLNPDTEILSGSVEALVGTLDEHPDIAGVVPLLEDPDGVSQHRWQLRRLPSVARLALGLSGAPAFSHPPSQLEEIAQPAAAAWLVRRSIWEALGGLDPSFAPAWWEDVDFCARLAAHLQEGPDFKAARGFVVQPAARVRHGRGASLVDLGDDAFLAAYCRNLLLYARRHHHASLHAIRASLRCSLAVRACLRPSRREAYRAALKAVKDRIRN